MSLWIDSYATLVQWLWTGNDTERFALSIIHWQPSNCGWSYDMYDTPTTGTWWRHTLEFRAVCGGNPQVTMVSPYRGKVMQFSWRRRLCQRATLCGRNCPVGRIAGMSMPKRRHGPLGGEVSWFRERWITHYDDVIMGAIASLITSLTSVHSTVYSDADQRKHQSSASLAFVWGIHRGPVNSPHKWPVKRKMFPFDDVIMMKLLARLLVIIKYRMLKTGKRRRWNIST